MGQLLVYFGWFYVWQIRPNVTATFYHNASFVSWAKNGFRYIFQNLRLCKLWYLATTKVSSFDLKGFQFMLFCALLISIRDRKKASFFKKEI
jgi:hypothetical protein